MRPQAKHKSKKINTIDLILLIVLVVGVVIGVYYWLHKDSSKNPRPETQTQTISAQNKPQEEPAKTGKLKIFTGEQFRDLYNNFAYPNTEYINEDTIITGNPDADKHIQSLAIKRGYLRRSAPVTDTFRVVQEGGVELQERAVQPWLDLKNAAKTAGLDLNLTAAYRSSKDQREIFLEQLNAYRINVSRIPEGIYDSQINQVLTSVAVPGYSRHHTGYTIDVSCGNVGGSSFKFTACFKWLEADNYKNSKLYGWIPSYPDGAGLQGPEPEPWEYVWVGVDAVTE